jgi:hypothetical protein
MAETQVSLVNEWLDRSSHYESELEDLNADNEIMYSPGLVVQLVSKKFDPRKKKRNCARENLCFMPTPIPSRAPTFKCLEVGVITVLVRR